MKAVFWGCVVGLVVLACAVAMQANLLAASVLLVMAAACVVSEL
jgi:hypothetical protein